MIEERIIESLNKIEKISSENKVDDIKLPAKEKLKFAKYVLLWIAILGVLGILSKLLYQDTEVFEACKTILPPIATLVLGYYFSKEE